MGEFNETNKFYVKTKDGVTATPEVKLARIRTHFKELFPLGCTKEELRALYSSFKVDDIAKKIKDIATHSAVIFMEDDVLKATALYLLMSRGSYDGFIFMSAYSLIEIYLQHNDLIKSIEELESSLIVLYLGYNEFENKRQADIIMQLMDQQFMRGAHTWLFYKGDRLKFKQKFPDLSQYVDNLEAKSSRLFTMVVQANANKTKKDEEDI